MEQKSKTHPRRRSFLRVTAGLSVTLALAAGPVARACEWTGLAGDDNWSSPANWTNCLGSGGVPEDGDTLTFTDLPSARTAHNDIADLDLQQIVFTGRDYTLAGNPIGLASGIAVNFPPGSGGASIEMDLTLLLDQPFEYIGASGTVALTGAIDLNNSELTFDGSAGGFEISGSISGDGAIVMNGGFSLVFSGDSTYTGLTTVNNGSLRVRHESALGAMGAGNRTVIAHGAGMTFEITSGAATIPESFDVVGGGHVSTLPGALNQCDVCETTLTGDIELVGETDVYSGSNSAFTIAGEVDGVGGLNSQAHADGGIVLDGNNTYSGVTIVLGGTLLINGSQPQSDVFVDSGVLGGTGTVGSITVLNNGTLGPGASPGILTGNGVQLETGATFEVELGGADPGNGHDQLVVLAGPVDLGDAALQATATFAPPPDTELVLIDNQASAPVQGTFEGLPEGSPLTIDGQEFTITYQGGDGDDVVLRAAGEQGGGPSSITVVKNATPVDGTFAYSGSLGDFEIETSDGSGSEVFDNLEPGGTWEVIESVPDGWTLAGIECENGDQTAVAIEPPSVSIDLGADDDVTCTFTNRGPEPVPALPPLATALLLALLLASVLWTLRQRRGGSTGEVS